MPELAYLNGVFSPINEAKVSIEDRGFQFGDGIYEVIVSYHSRLFMPTEHLDRLRTSAAAIGIEYDFEGKPLMPFIEEGLARSGFSEAMVYIQLTHGVAPRSHARPSGIPPTVVMTFKPRPVMPDDLRRQGAKIMTVVDDRWSRCYIKAITLLPNVLAKSRAVRQGYDDAVFVTESGEARECTSANLFIVRDGGVQFTPRTEAVLHGITQRFILQCAGQIGVPVCEEPILIEKLKSSDEAFMSSTVVEVLGITSIDGDPIGDGSVGPVTRRLHQAFIAGVTSRPRSTPV